MTSFVSPGAAIVPPFFIDRMQIQRRYYINSRPSHVANQICRRPFRSMRI